MTKQKKRNKKEFNHGRSLQWHLFWWRKGRVTKENETGLKTCIFLFFLKAKTPEKCVKCFLRVASPRVYVPYRFIGIFVLKKMREVLSDRLSSARICSM